MKRTFLIPLLTLTAFIANAQELPVRPVVRAATLPTPIGARQLITLRSLGMPDIAAAVELSYLQANIRHQQAAAQLSTSAVAQKPKSRSWLEQKQRDFKAWKLKRNRLKEQKKQEDLENKKAHLPQLQPDQTFQAVDFTAYTPEIKQAPRPVLPFVEEEKIAFRGLALSTDGNALRNILQNGLRIEDSGEESNTLRMAYASHGGYAALKPLIENPVINITCSPRSALYWGSKRLSADRRILVVIKLRGDWDGDGLEVVTTDIPASQIETLAVRLNIEGQLTWCKAELNADGSFTLTPYERVYAK